MKTSYENVSERTLVRIVQPPDCFLRRDTKHPNLRTVADSMQMAALRMLQWYGHTAKAADLT